VLLVKWYLSSKAYRSILKEKNFIMAVVFSNVFPFYKGVRLFGDLTSLTPLKTEDVRKAVIKAKNYLNISLIFLIVSKGINIIQEEQMTIFDTALTSAILLVGVLLLSGYKQILNQLDNINHDESSH
jgi:hypothetical protein